MPAGKKPTSTLMALGKPNGDPGRALVLFFRVRRLIENCKPPCPWHAARSCIKDLKSSPANLSLKIALSVRHVSPGARFKIRVRSLEVEWQVRICKFSVTGRWGSRHRDGRHVNERVERRQYAKVLC